VRKKFSERHGFIKPREAFQIESMDSGLRNRLWNRFDEYFLEGLSDRDGTIDTYYKFFSRIFDEYFKLTRKPSNYVGDLRNDHNIYGYFFRYDWYAVYDFLEYIAEIFIYDNRSKEFRIEINKVLEEEMSAYRFVDNYIAPIIDEVEIQEIEESLDMEYNGAKRHLSNALEFLSDRENPDYPNSIKESISAVEAVAKEITGKNTDLSKCLKAMDLDLNKQFMTAMDNMYGWTCKEDGIRHGHTGEELKTSFEEAKYMLVTCSAFVNYMIAKKG